MPLLPLGDKSVKNATLGDFVMKDGSLVDNAAELTDKQKAGCVGIVFCSDKDFIAENGTAEYTQKHPDILVIALKDAGSKIWIDAMDDISAFDAARPEVASEWYMPNIKELQYICRGNDSETAGTKGKSMIEAQYEKLGTAYAEAFGTTGGRYWSSSDSTKYPDTNAWYVDFRSGSSNENYGKNGFKLYYRLIFAI